MLSDKIAAKARKRRTAPFRKALRKPGALPKTSSKPAPDTPRCDECDQALTRYFDAADTGRDGWYCEGCGWSWDDR